MVEYDAIVNHVTMWNVAVERQQELKVLMLKITCYIDAQKFLQ